MKKDQPFRYGGQAVIDGVMMRGQTTVATAVRRPKGGIAVDVRPVARIYNGSLRKLPLIRGIIVLLESLVLGMGALNRSASIALEEEVKEVPKLATFGIIAFSVLLAVGIFVLAPFFLMNLMKDFITSSFLFNCLEGALRLTIFIVYVLLISRMDDIRNTFAYHGAEHATIAAYENGDKLEAGAIDSNRTAHARCGTSFVFMVLIIAILVFSFVGFQETWLMVLSRLLLLPIIAALSYELLMFTNRYSYNPIVKIIMMPGLLFQKLTTRKPSVDQLEVAITALRHVHQIDLAGGDQALASIARDLAQNSNDDIDLAYEKTIANLLIIKEKEGMEAIILLHANCKAKKMEIIPAIDLMDGKCVRLYQGDYQQKVEYENAPVEMARLFEKEGAHRIHVVDLDGAKAGFPMNIRSIEEICAAVSIPVEVGGGIRNIKNADELFSVGVDRIILGTAALEDKTFLLEALAKYKDKVVVGVDAKDGMVATHGWIETSSALATEFAQKMHHIGVESIIYTDIRRDGTLTEPNYQALEEMIKSFDGKVIASGGVSNISQLQKLRELGARGAIIGKAIYCGQIRVSDAVLA